MIRFNCLKDVYSLSGDLIFIKGGVYSGFCHNNINGYVVENRNYHLHYSEQFKAYFSIEI
jgi:hypothetical protein